MSGCCQYVCCALQELRSEIVPRIRSAVDTIHSQLDGELCARGVDVLFNVLYSPSGSLMSLLVSSQSLNIPVNISSSLNQMEMFHCLRSSVLLRYLVMFECLEFCEYV